MQFLVEEEKNMHNIRMENNKWVTYLFNSGKISRIFSQSVTYFLVAGKCMGPNCGKKIGKLFFTIEGEEKKYWGRGDQH